MEAVTKNSNWLFCPNFSLCILLSSIALKPKSRGPTVKPALQTIPLWLSSGCTFPQKVRSLDLCGTLNLSFYTKIQVNRPQSSKQPVQRAHAGLFPKALLLGAESITVVHTPSLWGDLRSAVWDKGMLHRA